MPTYYLLDNDKKKNQFSKEERLHLLSIMYEYAPLLDNKNASIVGRKEIWETIERRFNEAGFVGKTSAQLKKYWQNYKYHCKRTKTVRNQANGKRSSPVEKSKPDELPEEWNRGEIRSTGQPGSNVTLRGDVELVESRATPEATRDAARIAMERRRRDIFDENGSSFRKLSVPGTPTISAAFSDLDEKDGRGKKESKVPDLSIMKRELSPIHFPASEHFTSRKVDESIRTKDIGDESRSPKLIKEKSRNRTSAAIVVSSDEVSDNSVTVSIICPEGISKKPSDTSVGQESDCLEDKQYKEEICSSKSGQTETRVDRGSKFDRNRRDGICKVKQESDGRSSRDNPAINDLSIDKGPVNATKAKTRCFLLQRRQISSQNDTETNINEDDVSNAKINKTNICEKIPSRGIPELRSINVIPETRLKDDLPRDLEKVYSANNLETKNEFPGQFNEFQNICENINREQLHPENVSRKRRHDHLNTTNVNKSIERRQIPSEDGNGTRNDKIRVETDTNEGIRNQRQNSCDLLVQSELQELNHRLILRQLETEEKRLKVKIAEMAVQEVRFRIKALSEDMKRAEELHELRLALAAGKMDLEPENFMTLAEHQTRSSRLDYSG